MFESATFTKPTKFLRTRFRKQSSFNSALIEQAFDLSGATFSEVPDFRQAHCEEAPLLDDVKITSTSIKQRRSFDAPNHTITATYRALKRLAKQGHDHRHEVEFFAEELRTRQIMVHKRFGWEWWLSKAFAVTSDYGRSILRPVLWWLSVTVFSGFSYLLSALPDRKPNDIPDAAYHVILFCYHWMQSKLSIRFHISWLAKPNELSQVICEGTSTVSAAFNLSISKGLIAPGIADRSLLQQAYTCLYRGNVPFGISWTMGVQTVASTALLFLLLLAIRNRFKLK